LKTKILQKTFLSLTAGFPAPLATTTILAARRSNLETRASRDLLVTIQIFDDLSHETQVVLPAVQLKE
jgi:hypothetical protein